MARFVRTRAIARRVAAPVRRAATRVRTVYRNVATAPAGASRKRRAAAAVVRGGSFVAVAQGKAAPAAVGGYFMGKAERNQRTSEKPIIKDPRNRLMVELLGLSFARTKTSGLVTAAIDGAIGAVGCLYESYTNGGISSDVIPTKPAT